MPWKTDKDGNSFYIPENPDDLNVLSEEDVFLAIHSQSLIRKMAAPLELDEFMLEEMLKPITVNGVELKSRKEALQHFKQYRGKPFEEATRNGSGGAHLTTFCFANGMEIEDLLILKDKPDSPRYPEIKNRFEELRKGFYEMACCDDVPTREARVTDYYTKFMQRTEQVMDKFCQKDSLGLDDFVEFGYLSSQFQSIGVQSLHLGDKLDPQANEAGLHYVALIDEKLSQAGKPYTFFNFFNTSVFSAIGINTADSARRSLNGYKAGAAELSNTGVKTILVEHPNKALLSVEEFRKFFRKDGRTAAEKLITLTDEAAMDIQARTSPFEAEFSPENLKAYCIENMSRPKSFINYMTDVPEDTMAVLLQKKRSTLTGTARNSQEFEAVRNSFRKCIEEGNVNPRESKENDLRLYVACQKYIMSRSGSPASVSGKERLAAVSELMIKVGANIIENSPETAEKINGEISACAKHSKIFSGKLAEANRSDLQRLDSIEKETVSSLKAAMKSGGAGIGREAVIDSMAKLMEVEHIRRKAALEPAGQYMDNDFSEEYAEKMRPLLNDFLKKGDMKEVARAISGKNPGSVLTNLAEKHFGSMKNKETLVADKETSQLIKEAGQYRK